MRTIRVKPVQGMWLVDNDAKVMPLLFRGGAQAERNAKRLARGVADGGDHVQVLVHNLQGLIVGSVVYGPER